MNNKYLQFISDELLIKYAAEVIHKSQAKADAAEKDLYKNVIDPWSAAFDAARQGVTMENWIEQEKARQIQKTLQNAVGKFHQQVLGAVPGWHDTGIGGGYDVGNDALKIIAELKNKHNTTNSKSAPGVYNQLAGHLKFDKKGYIGYLVDIVPKSKKPYNKHWSPNKKDYVEREDIRRIDGWSFYELVTGEKNALRELYSALPEVISEVIGSKATTVAEAKAFSELFRLAYQWSEG